MLITHVLARGLLSFEDFSLALSPGLTVIVGPNGSGKSNLGRLIELARRATESADRRSTQLEETLQTFLSARREVLPPDGIEVRVGIELTEDFEKSLVVWYLRAAASAALLGPTSGYDTTAIDRWAVNNITERKVSPLFHGDIVVSHRGTSDAQWEVFFEFTVKKPRRSLEWYAWELRGGQPDSLIAAADLNSASLVGDQLADRLRGKPLPSGAAPTLPSGVFALSRLLPRKHRVVSCALDLGRNPPLKASRQFTAMIGLDALGGPDQNRHIGFARVISTILRRSLIQTSDSRLIPTPSLSWWVPEMQLRPGAEANLPEMLLLLKNGLSGQRQRYDDVSQLFWEFSNGRQMDVIVNTEASSDSEHDPQTGLRVAPQVVVSVAPAAPGDRGPIAQVPIDFAGAGAWEALLLAAVLGTQRNSTVVLDEPAVALHPTMQRSLRSRLQSADGQFLVITHSPYLLPLQENQKGTVVVRFDRDAGSATRPFVVDAALLTKISKKLTAKGNEGLPFARRAFLCEGETDVTAVRLIAARLNVDLDSTNIAVTDCGSRDNQPDYIDFCVALGIPFIVLMDGDASKAATDRSVQHNAQTVRDAVNAQPFLGALVEFPEDIETSFNVRKQRRSLVPAAIAKLDLTASKPREIALLVSIVRKFGAE